MALGCLAVDAQRLEAAGAELLAAISIAKAGRKTVAFQGRLLFELGATFQAQPGLQGILVAQGQMGAAGLDSDFESAPLPGW